MVFLIAYLTRQVYKSSLSIVGARHGKVKNQMSDKKQNNIQSKHLANEDTDSSLVVLGLTRFLLIVHVLHHDLVVFEYLH